jgi:predicted dehydrogenase
MGADTSAAAKKRPRYRAVIVGCGKIGALFESEAKREKPASHAGAVVQNPKTVLAALVDTSRRNLAIAGRMFPRAARYSSLAQCLKNERPDIVVISTPPAGRVRLVRACVQSGVKIIVCEKPLAGSVREGHGIGKVLAGSRTAFVLNYQRRFSPLFKRVREDIKRGAIGRLEQITCYYSNGLFNNGGHIIDALRYIVTERIVSVQATKNTKNTTHPRGDSNVDALLMTAGGITVALQSFDQRAYAIHDIHIMGTKGAITLTDFGQHGMWRSVGPSKFAGIRELSAVRAREQKEPLSATRGALLQAIRCFEHNVRPESGVESGIAALSVLEALKKSAAAGGKKVRVQY